MSRSFSRWLAAVFFVFGLFCGKNLLALKGRLRHVSERKGEKKAKNTILSSVAFFFGLRTWISPFSQLLGGFCTKNYVDDRIQFLQ